MKELIAKGILGWDGVERRSDRYGSIHLGPRPYNDDVQVEVEYTPALAGLLYTRVRLTATVIAVRKSGHIGDLTHGIRPEMPALGEVVDLGVGVLLSEHCPWDPNPLILLAPGDGRKVFWIDPRKLYRLHDQTVEVYAEATDEPFSAAPDLRAGQPATVVVEVKGDREFIQSKGHIPTHLAPKIESHGDGMFTIGPYKVGERIN